ncbi:MAG TPA: thioesterase family protein [Acidimicrobiales bacterium]|nr:thioesterase family protein [Acidimicrobiales bacterium]
MGYPTFSDQMARLAPDPERPGRYLVDVDECWNCPTVPQGGVMAAVAAAAMTAELGLTDQHLRTLTTVFAAQLPAGPVAVDVEVLRRGRSMSQMLATARAGGDGVGHTTVAVFGVDQPGFEFTDLRRPNVSSPPFCVSFRDPPPPGVPAGEMGEPFAFWQHVEGRPAMGHAPWDPFVPSSSECAMWYRFDEAPMRPDGTLDPLAVVALSDLMPSSVSQRMGPGQADFYPPSADLTVHVLDEARSPWLLAHLRARRATDGYASVEAALWDEAGTLVAHAAQLMFLRFPGGPPEGDERLPADLRP